MKRAISYFVLLIVMCCPVIATSGMGHKDFVLLLEDFGRGDYAVEGHFQVPVSRSTIWKVLTDYDHMPEFISSMHESKVEQRDRNRLMLKQRARGKLFVFSKHIEVLLSVIEIPMTQITFEDVSSKDFYSYQGSWEIQGEGAGPFDVVYRLNARRKFSAPGFLAKTAFKNNVESLLNEVRMEIVRRQEGGIE